MYNDHPPDKIIRVQDLSQKTGLSPITITEILYILESLDLLVVYYISRHNKCRKVIKKDRIDNDDEYFCDHCLEDIDSEKDIIVETVFYNKGV